MESPSTTRLLFIPLTELRQYWPVAREFILAAAKQADEMTEEMIVTELLQTKMQLILVLEGEQPLGAVTGKVIGDTAWMVHLGGLWGRMKDFLPDFETWARAKGARKLRIQGRLGWARRLRAFGFEEKFTTLEKSL